MIFNEFYTQLIRKGLESFGLYYATYEGNVSDNLDPDNRGRIKILCPAVYGKQRPDKWVYPRGLFYRFYGVPEIGDPVWISFRNGSAKFPLWEYGWIPKGKSVEEARENVFVLKTPKGNKLILNDNIDEVLLHKEGNGYISLSDKIEIKYNDENFKIEMVKFLDALINAIIQTPNGPGNFAPNTVSLINQFKLKIEKMFK